MKFLILTISLIVAPVHIVYGQEKSTQSDPHRDSAKDTKKTAPQTKPSSSASVNVINQQASSAQENRPEEKSQGYFSRLFTPENLPNIGLVIVGIIGILVAVRTLRSIEQQTAALIEGQRPKIEIKARNSIVNTFTTIASFIDFEIINRGASMATNVRYEAWWELLQAPYDFTNSAHHKPFSGSFGLTPNGEPMAVELTFRPVNLSEITEIRTGKLSPCLRIHLKYDDAFKKDRDIEEAYRFLPKGLAPIPKYYKGEY
jgi:hypothetical protein